MRSAGAHKTRNLPIGLAVSHGPAETKKNSPCRRILHGFHFDLCAQNNTAYPRGRGQDVGDFYESTSARWIDAIAFIPNSELTSRWPATRRVAILKRLAAIPQVGCREQGASATPTAPSLHCDVVDTRSLPAKTHLTQARAASSAVHTSSNPNHHWRARLCSHGAKRFLIRQTLKGVAKKAPPLEATGLWSICL